MKYEKNASSGTLVAGGNGDGTKTNQLAYPSGLHFEVATNSLLIANTDAHNVVRWKLGDSNWTLIGGRLDGFNGTGPADLSNPFDVISDRLGNIYIADTFNFRVQLYPVNQTNATTIISSTDPIVDAYGPTMIPCSIALDNQMNLYIGNAIANQVQQFKHY